MFGSLFRFVIMAFCLLVGGCGSKPTTPVPPAPVLCTDPAATNPGQPLPCVYQVPIPPPPPPPPPPVDSIAEAKGWSLDQCRDFVFSVVTQYSAVVSQDAINAARNELAVRGFAWQNDVFGRTDWRPRVFFPNSSCSMTPVQARDSATPADCVWAHFADLGEYGKPWVWDNARR